MNGQHHIPVLSEEVYENLISIGCRVFIDATVGGGGHALGMLDRNRDLHLIGIDRDQEALDQARETLKEHSDRVTLLRGNFRDLNQILQGTGVFSIDGILFDLGISSYQLAANRGFSFIDDEELDMRMDPREEMTAYKVVNYYRQEQIARVLYEFGEEWQSRRIARAIVERRKKEKIQTAKQLADLVASVKKREGKIHPATKTFQALRIAVNDELASLEQGLGEAIPLLNGNGRIGVITFHSLEDRIVKERFRKNESLRILTRKPIRPSLQEIRDNPRSRSAKLRVAEKI